MNQELERILTEVEKAISGKRAVIEKILMAILSDGHILLDDVPGVGKTTLALALLTSSLSITILSLRRRE